jgi:hypothetical protein
MLQSINNTLKELSERRETAPTESARAVMENLESCVRSAYTIVVSTASSINDGLTQAGSVPGPLPSPDIVRQIEDWDLPVESNPIAPSSVFSASGHRPGHGDDITTSIRRNSDSTASPRTKVMIEHWQRTGRSSFQVRKYKDAEAPLRMAYTESAILDGPRFEGWQQLLRMLVVSNCKLGKLEDAGRWLLDVLKGPASQPSVTDDDILVSELTERLALGFCDADRKDDAIQFITQVIEIKKERKLFFLDAQRTLAEIYLRKGELTTAENLCREIDTSETFISGYPREILDETTILMALICNTKGDHVNGGGHEALLLPAYKSILLLFNG